MKDPHFIDPRRNTKGNKPSLMEVHPDCASKWSPTLNGAKTPWDVTPQSNLLVYWDCGAHYWKAPSSKVVAGQGCGVCAFKVLWPGVNDLATTSPELEPYFRPEDNGGLTASKVMGGQSNKRYNWRCKFFHMTSAPVYSRAKGYGCGVCEGKILMPGFNDLATTNPELRCELLPANNTGLDATRILGGASDAVYVWTCHLGHDWPAKVGTRTRGKGCPFCADRRLLVGFNDLATTNPELASQLDPGNNGGYDATMVLGGRSNAILTWTCLAEKGHIDWDARVADRTQGTGCPACQTSKVERALVSLCSKLFDSASGGVKLVVPWRKRRIAEVDVVVQNDDKQIVIEYDGIFRHSSFESWLRDTDKTRAMLDAGFRVVRIRSNDLAHLEIIHPNLLQLDHPYRWGADDRLESDLIPTVASIVTWAARQPILRA